MYSLLVYLWFEKDKRWVCERQLHQQTAAAAAAAAFGCQKVRYPVLCMCMYLG